MEWSRRRFVKVGLGSLGTLCIPAWSWADALAPAAGNVASGNDDQHFFLQILVPNGMDPTYLFDARPLTMTAAGKIQNYLGADPSVWTGVNGLNSLATSLTDPLKPFRSNFSVLNGVMMATNFDGHEQNMNFLFTGDAFGGNSFIPHLNLGAGSTMQHLPMDALQMGLVPASVSNGSGTVPLTMESAKLLVEKLRVATPLMPQNPLIAFIRQRMAAAAQGDGRFSAGAQAMMAGYDQAPALANMLKQLDLGDVQGTEETKFLTLVAELFRKGAVRSAILSVASKGSVDTHDNMSCKASPALFTELVGKFAQVLTYLRDTPFDSKRSLMDVTTFMITSEFGRTMRQVYAPSIDQTGTDHNPLSNSVIMGGKGIRGGMVVGQSDFQSATEVLSKTHVSFDPMSVKLMGRPFDFTTLKPRPDLPETYNVDDYLNVASVANTVYSMFGVPQTYYRLLKRGMDPAPVLSGLLS